MNKGEVYYVSKDAVTNSKYCIEPGRPAIIVSTASANSTENTVCVVYMTSKPKMSAPTHFVTHCNGVTGTALCETISTVDKAQLGKYIGKLSEHEIESLNNSLRAMFDLGDEIPYASSEDLRQAHATIEALKKQVEAYRTILFSSEVK
jgi:mRNA-degrading endonuclease toxin of MazEF toxin-antitoxin module